jgi:hypothetical protein
MLGLGKLEIDIVHNPQCGLYDKPLGNELLEQQGHTALPFDTEGKTSSE